MLKPRFSYSGNVYVITHNGCCKFVDFVFQRSLHFKPNRGKRRRVSWSRLSVFTSSYTLFWIWGGEVERPVTRAFPFLPPKVTLWIFNKLKNSFACGHIRLKETVSDNEIFCIIGSHFLWPDLQPRWIGFSLIFPFGTGSAIAHDEAAWRRRGLKMTLRQSLCEWNSSRLI